MYWTISLPQVGSKCFIRTILQRRQQYINDLKIQLRRINCFTNLKPTNKNQHNRLRWHYGWSRLLVLILTLTYALYAQTLTHTPQINKSKKKNFNHDNYYITIHGIFNNYNELTLLLIKDQTNLLCNSTNFICPKEYSCYFHNFSYNTSAKQGIGVPIKRNVPHTYRNINSSILCSAECSLNLNRSLILLMRTSHQVKAFHPLT